MSHSAPCGCNSISSKRIANFVNSPVPYGLGMLYSDMRWSPLYSIGLVGKHFMPLESHTFSISFLQCHLDMFIVNVH